MGCGPVMGRGPMGAIGAKRKAQKPVSARQFVALLFGEAERNPAGRIIIFTTNSIGMLDPALQARPY